MLSGKRATISVTIFSVLRKPRSLSVTLLEAEEVRVVLGSVHEGSGTPIWARYVSERENDYMCGRSCLWEMRSGPNSCK